MPAITYSQLSHIRKKYRKSKIVYVSGTFDLTHINHVEFFSKAKKLGDILVVGVGPDIDVRKNKGGDRPIQNQDVRLKMVSLFKSVDFCFLGKPLIPNAHHLTRMAEIFSVLRPDIYYLNLDASDLEYRKNICKKFGIKMIVSKPSLKYAGLTTSKIIAGILEKISP